MAGAPDPGAFGAPIPQGRGRARGKARPALGIGGAR